MRNNTKKSVKERTPARPRDAAATKERILRCATKEFARRGFDGARIDSIVKAADVNISLAYQYFGNKEKLYLEVMEGAYTVMRARHHEIDIRDEPPIAAMQTLVRRCFRIFIEFPEIINLLNSENLQEGRHIAKSKFIRKLYNPLLDTIAAVLERGCSEGVFRRGVDPLELFISITAEGYFYLANKHTLGVILDRDMMAKRALARHERHIVDVILGFLTKMEAQQEAPQATLTGRGRRT